ncbi:class I SAM-dependent methyltransferase [uncultured Agrococcus sp.]|uniref:class I SAM-dependent methyltransferase n=1 Tax=uncultured Agrococcus sp. TaxID=382258 RepID=UPI0025DCD073|nr:class I SAM-dependent methyltransferase [uncultured Agrococcus sp.]
MHDYDPRIVDLYDGDNPDGPDHDYYRSLADELDAASILDIGCGTGILTVTFVRQGRSVTGVDPSPAMLAKARARSGGEEVEWIDGDSSVVPHREYRYAVMTGNVAQHIPDGDWERTLGDVARVMQPGGVLAFESRNPEVRAWEAWAAEPESTRETMHGRLREWTEVGQPKDGRVVLTFHNEFVASGEHLVQQEVLAFRSKHEIERALIGAGFSVRAVHGGWGRESFEPDSRLMIFEAVRN